MRISTFLFLAIAPLLNLRSVAAAEAGAMHHAGHGDGMPAAAAPGDLGATAVFDARGTLWAAYKTAAGVVVNHSTDLGRTWSGPVAVGREPEPTDGGADSRPKIAVGPGGEIYVTWTRPLAKPYTGEIRFTRSLDGGRTSDPPKTVHHDRQVITHRFDALTVDARGRVVVAWVDKRDLTLAGGAAYRGAAIYFARSDDRGASFGTDTKLADHSCECCRIGLVPRPDGSVVALWRHVFEPNVRDHAMAVITPEGRAGPLERASFDGWAIDACPHQGPALAIDEHGVRHAVWFTAAPSAPGVFYGRPVDGRVEGLRAVGGRSAERPDIAVYGRQVAVVWKEFDGTRSQLRGLISADGGVTWRELALGATDGASDHPRLFVRDGRFHVFWHTRLQPLAVIPFP
jgi:hypothetical protein